MIHRKHFIASVFGLAMACLAVFPLTAGADSDDADRSFVISVPTVGWPPYFIVPDQDGPIRGIMADVLREACKATANTATFTLYPEKRGRVMLEEGTIDAYPKAKEWMDNPNKYLWTAPVVTSTDILILRRHSSSSLPAATIKGLDVGVVHGFTYPTLDPLFKSGAIRRHAAEKTECLLRMVSRGHIDAAVTNRHVAQWLIRTSPELKAGDFLFGKVIDSAPYRFAFTRTPENTRFVSSFDRELARMKEDGRLQAILDKYL